MTLSIAFLFAVLAVMVWSFMTEKLPVELTAFVGLLVLVFTEYVEPNEAFTGFASPAVITMFSIFFISAALLATGVADVIGGRLAHLGGGKEVPLIILLMLVAGVLSAFMNNVAAAAVLLPAVSSVARHSGISPGRLFMPLSFGAILGGTTTLVGTPPNILATEVLQNRGLEPFGLFDFTPLGLALLGAGILFMTTFGRRLLPERTADKKAAESAHLTRAYRLAERLTSIRIPEGSPLDGLPLREAHIGRALDVQVVAVERRGRRHLAPPPDFLLGGGDVLLVDGHFDDLRKLLGVQGVGVDEADPGHLGKVSAQIEGAILRPARSSGLVGRSLRQLRFRDRFSVLVVGIRRGRDLVRQQLARRVVRASDELLALGTDAQIAALGDQKGIEIVERGIPLSRLLEDQRLSLIHVPKASSLVGSSLRASRLSELAGVTVIGIVRRGETHLAVDVNETIEADDELVLACEPTRILELLELGDLELRPETPSTGLGTLESAKVGVTEAVVAPRSRAAGRNLKRLRFREHYGLQVLALWRGGSAIHHDLADLPLRFGDALLLHGPRKKIEHLADDSEDFVVLGRERTAPRRTEKAPVALAALGVMIALVASGLYPIHVAAFAGAVTSVLFGALRMDEAYRAIEWRAIFLVAAILPVGVAMERSGAALWLADLVASVAESYGPHAFLASLVVLSSLLSQGLDGAPTVVILAPVVLLTAEKLGYSPYPLMMAVGLAASAAFMTPFSHKANLLVMSAGGYRAMDYVRVGTPLTLVVFVLLVTLVPIFFPFDLPAEAPGLEAPSLEAPAASSLEAPGGSGHEAPGQEVSLLAVPPLVGRVTASTATLSVASGQEPVDAEAFVEGESMGVAHLEPYTVHHFELEGLEPGREQTYRIAAHSSSRARDPPSGQTFQGRLFTARPPGEAFTFAVFADPHLPVPDLSWATSSDPIAADALASFVAARAEIGQTIRHTVASIHAARPDFVVCLGDQFTMWGGAFNGPFDSAVQAQVAYLDFRDHLGPLAAEAAFFPVIGNWDGESGWHPEPLRAVARQARQRYTPTFTDASPHGDYYAFVWGDGLFVVLNVLSYTPTAHTLSDTDDGTATDWTLGDAQKAWLEDLLVQAEQPVKLIFAHHPVGGAGGDVRNSAYGRGGGRAARVGEQEWLHAQMREHGVLAFFYGHDHVFTEMGVDGVRYILPGSAGAPWKFSRAETGYTDYDERSGFALVQIAQRRVTVEMIGLDGEVVRRLEL